MKTKIYIALTVALLGGDAANAAEKADSLETLRHPVHIAFGSTDEKDLPSGIEHYSVSENMKHDFTLGALEGAPSYVAGYDGNLWGQGALVLVDGVPRDAGHLLPSEIEDISFLKSAAAVALYGSRGAKGVILITTKRGKAKQNVIDVRANTGFYVPKRYPKFLSSWEYMTLYNEALRNDGLDELYTADEIYLSSTGNSYRYPDTNYYSGDYLKKATNRSDVTAEFSGGSDKARFYSTAGLMYQNTLLNVGKGKDEYNLRFNVRGNIDFTFNDLLSANVDANTVLYSNKRANGNFWSEAATMRPNQFSPLIPLDHLDANSELSAMLGSANTYDGYLLGGSQIYQTNAIADAIAGGHYVTTSRIFQMTVGLDFNFGRWIEGLTFKPRFSIDYSSGYSESYNNQYATYSPTWYTGAGNTDILDSLTKYGEDRTSGKQNVNGSWYQQTLHFSGQFDYVRSFRRDHNIHAILLASGYQYTQNGTYHKTSAANLGIQLSYNWAHRYYADFTGAIIHSAKMAPGKRNAFSPALTLAWRMKNENWLKDVDWLNDLKLTLSGGIINTDLDFPEYYMYKGYFTQTSGAWTAWNDGTSSIQSSDSRRADNPDLTFAKRKEITAGIKASLLGESLKVSANWFINRMSGLPVMRYSLYPVWFSTGWPNSSFIPYSNYNEDERSGFDFAINYSKRIGEVNLAFGFNGMIMHSKVIKRDENFNYDYRSRVGHRVDGIWGLQSDGLFHCQDDIDAAPKSTFGEVKPGDIRYIDQNGDGVIDDDDEVYLGSGGWAGNPFSYGITMQASWKGFTLFMRGDGVSGSKAIKDGAYYWVYGDRKYSEAVLDRWTFATARTATYPRLTTLSSANNFRTSDFWLYSTSRFTLSKIQLSYDFNPALFGHSPVKGLNIYISADNLLMIAKNRKILETTVGSEPQCRFYNLGLKVNF